MTDREKFQKTFDHLHASAGTLTEVIKMTQNSSKKPPIRTYSRRLIVAAAALALVLALGVTAYATGFAESVIARLGDGYYSAHDPERDARYDRIGELSDKEPETVVLDSLSGPGAVLHSAVTLEESYYDGEDFALAYSLDALSYPIEFGFGPGDEYFDELFAADETLDILGGLHEFMTDEEHARIREMLDSGESFGFVIRYVGLGDHVTLADGTDLGPMVGGEVDGKRILECQNGLPEAAKGLDALELVFKLKLIEGYYYVDADGTRYYHYPPAEYELVPFTIESCA